MKHVYLFFLLIISGSLMAQTQNPDFELWEVNQNSFNVSGNFSGINFTINEPTFNYNDPEDWSSTNQLTQASSFSAVSLVTESANAVSGSASLRLQSQTISITVQTDFGPFDIENVAPALVVSGNIDLDVQALIDELVSGGSLNALNPFEFPETGQPIDFRPKTLYGQYQYTGTFGDSCIIAAGALKDREMVAYAITRLGNTASNTWTPFALDFEFLSCDMPDTIVTLICASNLDINLNDNGEFEITSDYTGQDGSLMLIDDLSMDTTDISSFPPIAINDFSTILNIEVATVDVVANDDFCDGADPDPTVVNGPANGSVTLLGSGELEYTPNAGFTGTEIITYEVCNNGAVCDTATWEITVNGIQPCVADDITITIAANTVELVDVSNANCDGTPSIVTNGNNGVADVEGNDQISYSPATNFSGNDTIVYSICNVNDPNQCDTGMIFITVITSINELAKTAYEVFPNPVNNQINVSLIDMSDATVLLFGLDGSLIYSGDMEQNLVIPCSGISNGTYILRIVTDEGVANEKLIVSK